MTRAKKEDMATMTEGRRSLVGWLLAGGLVTSISSFIYPAIKFMMPPNVPEAAMKSSPARFRC
jgi:hypothetical protein